MIKKIVSHPNSILRKKCQKVEKITDEIKKLGLDMIETMKENQGIGLAAPQVEHLIRLIVIQSGKEGIVLINPEIIRKSRTTEIMEEGCLSIPKLFFKIKRAKTVEVTALNIGGEKIRFTAKGFLSRVIQHEIDHLDGILFIDRANIFHRWRIKGKLKAYGLH